MTDSLASLACDDPAKALVMAHLRQLVAGGAATWEPLDNGDVELSFAGGGTFLLTHTAVVRLL